MISHHYFQACVFLETLRKIFTLAKKASKLQAFRRKLVTFCFQPIVRQSVRRLKQNIEAEGIHGKRN